MSRAPESNVREELMDGPADGRVRTVSFVSLGCPKNLVDSEKMLGLLAQDGLSPVAYDAEGRAGADAVVINTCGFLEASKEESLEVIREAIRRKEAGEVKRVVVAGCLVQRHRAKMLEWAPGIDAMIGVFDRDRVVEAVRGPAGAGREGLPTGEGPRYWIAGNALQAARERGREVTGLTVNGKDGKGIGYFEDDSARLRLTPRHYAYLRVSEGCNQNCAFCTIPSIRGKMRSKPLERIAAEAAELIRDGAFELNLIGQDTTSYGDDVGRGFNFDGRGGGGLPELLRALDGVVRAEGGGHGWIRLMYAYPTTFNDAMIDAIGGLERVVKYIDMPLQHASDRMLGLMRRNVTAAQQRELVLRLRDRVPGLALRTTFITGFPGETEEDHEQLMELVNEIGFDAMGVFEYSREEHTPAGTMDADPALHVPAEVKSRRRAELMELQQSIAFEQAKFVAAQFDEARPLETGLQFDVLIDRVLRSEGRATAGVGAGGRLFQGRCYFQAPDVDSVTFVQSREPLSPGELVRCTVVGSDGYDLVAKPVSELEKRVSLSVVR
ncbi:MAG: 30S ribosomal protein S12 methylthiotransferase RimO [Planctomycetota bacterium]|nr:30S ribosomal protein S12 methylthiotransferase RimO [Planctomycetota bacterium]